MIYLHCGRRELGKTWLAIWLALRATYRMEFGVRKRGLPIFPGATVLREDPELTAFSSTDWLDRNFNASRPVAVIPRLHVNENFNRFLRGAKGWIDTHEAGLIARNETLAIVIDEARLIKLNESEVFDELARDVSREHVHVIITTHRPAEIHPDTRALIDRYHYFQMSEKNDLKFVMDQCGPRVAHEVRNLKPHEFVLWDDGRGTYRVRKDSATFAPTGELVTIATSTPELLEDIADDQFFLR